MARFKVFIEYDGTRYSGWQIQKNARTIQGEFFTAIKKIFKTEDFEFHGSGRTDAGVHALEQVAHLDVQTMLAPEIIKYKLNDILPSDICVLEVEKCDKNFNARKDAIARSYIYVISRRRSAFAKKFIWWIKDKIDVKKINEASKLFVGMRDFKSFTDDDPEEKSTLVNIEKISVVEDGNLILIRIIGSHFIWKLVRRIVGVLAEIGRGKMPIEKINYFLSNKSDEPAKLTAPPSGLFLEKVFYRKEELLSLKEPEIIIKL